MRRPSCPKRRPPPSPDIPGTPESLESDPPGLGEDDLPGPTAELPQPHGQELDSRETAIAPDPDPQPDPPEEPEDEVDLLTREFWPWLKGKWDDINNAIHWYRAEPGRMDKTAEERQGGQGGRGKQAGQAGGPGGQASPGIRTGRGESRESPDLGQQDKDGSRRQVAVGRGAGRPAAEATPPDLRDMAETDGGRGLPGRPVHRGRPDSLRRGLAATENVPRIADRPGTGGRPRAGAAAAGPGGI